MDVGAWIDGGQPSDKGVDAWADRIASAGINTAILSLNVGIKPVWVPRWKPEKLARCTDALHARSIKVQWMPWVRATKQAIDEQVAGLAALFAHSKPDRLSPDCEGSTRHAGWGVEGVGLAAYYAQKVGALAGCPDQFGVTAIPPMKGIRPQDMAMMEALAELGPVEGQPQGYSQYQPKKSWTHNALFRPGPIQRHVLESWYDSDGNPIEPLSSIRFGQMGFYQNHPGGPRGVEALQLAHDTVTAAGVDKVAYWAWKGMRGSPATVRFLQRISNGGYKFEDTGTMRADSVREMQGHLADAAYQPGPIDGKLGPRTVAAATSYRDDARHKPDTLINHRLIELINQHVGTLPAPWRDAA